MTKVFTDKEQLILTITKMMVWKYGIKKTRIKDICEEAGISKMTFYRSFSNKQDAIQSALELEFRKSLKAYQQIMESKQPFTVKCAQLVELERNNAQDLDTAFIKDLQLADYTPIRAQLLDYQNTMESIIKSDFTQAQQSGFIRDDISIEAILFFLRELNAIYAKEGFIELHQSPQEASVALTKLFFYGILPNNKPDA